MKPSDHSERSREHAEDAGGAIAVLEVAPGRRTATYEQHGRDRERRYDDDDDARPDQAHNDLSTGARPTTGES